MKKKQTLFEFPCQFPIKVIGGIDSDLKTIVTQIIEKYVDPQDIVEINLVNSTQGNFVSVTALIMARDQKLLDTLYQKLSKHKAIKMVL